MNIPETAYDSAIHHLINTAQSPSGWLSDLPGSTVDDRNKSVVSGSIGGTIDVTQAVVETLTVALPHIEAALRTQIAADIRALKTKADLMSATDLKRNSAIDDAARIAEEGTTK